jgi:hypothetical protein
MGSVLFLIFVASKIRFYLKKATSFVSADYFISSPYQNKNLSKSYTFAKQKNQHNKR